MYFMCIRNVGRMDSSCDYYETKDHMRNMSEYWYYGLLAYFVQNLSKMP
jgi:hypothetical protein